MSHHGYNAAQQIIVVCHRHVRDRTLDGALDALGLCGEPPRQGDRCDGHEGRHDDGYGEADCLTPSLHSTLLFLPIVVRYHPEGDRADQEKSPPSGKNPDSTGAVERRLRRAEDQFAGYSRAHGQSRWIICNGRYLNTPDTTIGERIVKEMRLQGIDEVVQIRKDGTTERFGQ